MAFTEVEVAEYFQETKKILFATRRGEGTDIRILGGFATEELITCFISAKDTDK
jgi:hypothetical protein